MPIDIDLRRVEELGLNSSAPPSQLLYDGWLLRLWPGQAKRARSVNAVYPSTRPLKDKLAYCEQLYRSHQLPLIFRITPFSEPAALDVELEARGFPKFDLTAVETAPIKAPTPSTGPAEPLDLPAWVDAIGELRQASPAHRTRHLQRLQSSPLDYRALAIHQGGRVVATGLTIVEDGWAGLFDIATDAPLRRRGHGRQIVQALLKQAWLLGARQAYLQVSADNTAARTLYAAFGFRQQYQYWYRGQAD